MDVSWDAAGALGEIGGGIAVVATLFYLSDQAWEDAWPGVVQFARMSPLYERYVGMEMQAMGLRDEFEAKMAATAPGPGAVLPGDRP